MIELDPFLRNGKKILSYRLINWMKIPESHPHTTRKISRVFVPYQTTSKEGGVQQKDLLKDKWMYYEGKCLKKN